jgi:iron complex transport system ATP-binding protein
MIRAIGLKAGYHRNRHVLAGVDLTVEKGELLGILGPNGSGKTTLLRCLYGSIVPFGGCVEVDGRDIGSLGAREVARRMAVVPQETDPGFDFSVLEVVSMGRYPWMGWFGNGKNGHMAKIDEALKMTGMLHLKGRSMSELSGGERRLAYLARSLAQSSEVMLLDEPTRGLDVGHAHALMRLLRQLCAERGLTVIAVLHDLDSALRNCDRALLLKDGRAISCGPPVSVLSTENVREAFGVGSVIRTLDGRRHMEVFG